MPHGFANLDEAFCSANPSNGSSSGIRNFGAYRPSNPPPKNYSEEINTVPAEHRTAVDTDARHMDYQDYKLKFPITADPAVAVGIPPLRSIPHANSSNVAFASGYDRKPLNAFPLENTGICSNPNECSMFLQHILYCPECQTKLKNLVKNIGIQGSNSHPYHSQIAMDNFTDFGDIFVKLINSVGDLKNLLFIIIIVIVLMFVVSYLSKHVKLV